MSLVAAKCSSCGGILKVESTLDAAICPYCNTPYIVEKAINQYNMVNNIKANVVNIFESDSRDSNGTYGKTCSDELTDLYQSAPQINVSDKVRFIAKWAAEKFVEQCKNAAKNGKRQHSAYAGDGYEAYTFVDRSAVQEDKRTIVEWYDFIVQSEERFDDLDSFIYALKIMLKESGLPNFKVWETEVKNPPTVRVNYFGIFGQPKKIESVAVPSWYVIIQANW